MIKLDRAVSRVAPIWYLVAYIFLIPVYGLLYTVVEPHGFYAPYAKLEPSAISDANNLAEILARELRRTALAQPPQAISISDWQLDLSSLQVDDVSATESGQLTFRIRLNAEGTKQNAGQRQLGWSALITVSERPVRETIAGPNSTIFRLLDADTSKYISPFSVMDKKILSILFPNQRYGFGNSAPILALTTIQDEKFRRYIRGTRGDPDAFSSQLLRMIYLSAVVATTLGLGDIMPITPLARTLVASEAIFGILIAGLFLNAAAYRAGRGE